jgi:SPX domain protein involved in polyphosphate accumulation/uncharacterized membrane protein YidH (DUF202 family)
VPHWIRSTGSPGSTRRFVAQLDDELTRVDGAIKAHCAELDASLRFLHRRRASATLADADALGRRVVILDRFVAVNYAAFRHLAELHAELLDESLTPWIVTRLHASVFGSLNLDHMILNLSSIYESIRGKANGAVEWTAPDSFVRKTTKYMVSPLNLARVKAMIVKHLPVLLFDNKKKTGADADDDGDGDDVVGAGARDSGVICSVYFDNRRLDSYHTRLDRLEGSTLLRVRWYESGKRELFVERKTHHDSWVSTKSIKERFSLAERHATDYFTGRWSVSDDADGAVLARELQDEIVQREFRPALRTVYRRVAFQESHSNAVRISIDSEMSFVNERALGRGRGAEWRSAIERVDGADVSAFPHCILEIKLTTAEPIGWLDELLGSGLLQPVPKFSKFLHGTATMHRALVQTLPPWWAELSKLPVVVWTEKVEEVYRDEDDDEEEELRADDDVRRDQKKEKKPATTKKKPVMIKNDDVDADVDSEIGRASAFSFRNNTITPLRLPIKIEPKTFFANERTFLQWLNTLLLLAVGSSAFIAYGSEPFQVAGTLLVVISLVFVLYALAVYHWRRRAIVRRSVTRAYDDQFGPAALVALVVLTFVLSVVLQFAVEPQSLVQAEALPVVK